MKATKLIQWKTDIMPVAAVAKCCSTHAQEWRLDNRIQVTVSDLPPGPAPDCYDCKLVAHE